MQSSESIIADALTSFPNKKNKPGNTADVIHHHASSSSSTHHQQYSCWAAVSSSTASSSCNGPAGPRPADVIGHCPACSHQSCQANYGGAIMTDNLNQPVSSSSTRETSCSISSLPPSCWIPSSSSSSPPTIIRTITPAAMTTESNYDKRRAAVEQSASPFSADRLVRLQQSAACCSLIRRTEQNCCCCRCDVDQHAGAGNNNSSHDAARNCCLQNHQHQIVMNNKVTTRAIRHSPAACWIKVPWATLAFAMFLFVLYSSSYTRVQQRQQQQQQQQPSLPSSASACNNGTLSSLSSSSLSSSPSQASWQYVPAWCDLPCLNFTSAIRQGQYSRLISAQLGFYDSPHFAYIAVSVCSKALFSELHHHHQRRRQPQQQHRAALFVFSFAIIFVSMAACYAPVTIALATVARSEAILGGCSVGLSGVAIAMLLFLLHRANCSWKAATAAVILEAIPLYWTVHRPHPSTISLHLTGVLVGLALILVTGTSSTSMTWASAFQTTTTTTSESHDRRTAGEKPNWFDTTVNHMVDRVSSAIDRTSTLLCIFASVAMAILSYRLLPPSIKAGY